MKETLVLISQHTTYNTEYSHEYKNSDSSSFDIWHYTTLQQQQYVAKLISVQNVADSIQVNIQYQLHVCGCLNYSRIFYAYFGVLSECLGINLRVSKFSGGACPPHPLVGPC